MKNFRRDSPTVNTGSMADIAFLLLIFFLVTTTISADRGILRKLPSECPTNIDCSKDINERNILRIVINANDDIMIEDEITSISELKTIAKDFIDNNGKAVCEYCFGKGLKTASDQPTKAIISLKHDAKTKYKTLIAVQDELSKAYYELRKIYVQQKFNKSPNSLTKIELVEVKEAYPFILSEATVKQDQ